MITLYVFLLIVGALGALAYVFLFFSHVPGAKDERLGKLEELPPNMGKWIECGEEGGLIREQRHLFADPSGVDQLNLVLQVRYRDPTTLEIVRIEPEKKHRRRRKRG